MRIIADIGDTVQFRDRDHPHKPERWTGEVVAVIYPTTPGAEIIYTLRDSVGTVDVAESFVDEPGNACQALLAAVVRNLEAEGLVDDTGNAPGHRHPLPGHWEEGKPCAWCQTWAAAKAMIAGKTEVLGSVVPIDETGNWFSPSKSATPGLYWYARVGWTQMQAVEVRGGRVNGRDGLIPTKLDDLPFDARFKLR